MASATGGGPRSSWCTGPASTTGPCRRASSARASIRSLARPREVVGGDRHPRRVPAPGCRRSSTRCGPATPLADKVVDYWAMTRRRRRSAFTPAPRSTSSPGCRADAALASLSYPHDQPSCAAFARTAPGAPARSCWCAMPQRRRTWISWPGPDSERPLGPCRPGRAAPLGAGCRCFGPQRLGLRPAGRCRRRWSRWRTALGLPIEVDATFDRGRPTPTPRPERFAASPTPEPTVVCGQGKLIPPARRAVPVGATPRYRDREGRGLGALLHRRRGWTAPDRARRVLALTVVCPRYRLRKQAALHRMRRAPSTRRCCALSFSGSRARPICGLLGRGRAGGGALRRSPWRSARGRSLAGVAFLAAVVFTALAAFAGALAGAAFFAGAAALVPSAPGRRRRSP